MARREDTLQILSSDSVVIRMKACPSPAVRSAHIPQEGPAPCEPQSQFWSRLARALAMLMAAVAAHVWLVRAPQPPAPAAAIVQPTATAIQSTAPRARHVRVAIDTITVPSASIRRSTPRLIDADRKTAVKPFLLSASLKGTAAAVPAGTTGVAAAIEPVLTDSTPSPAATPPADSPPPRNAAADTGNVSALQFPSGLDNVPARAIALAARPLMMPGAAPSEPQTGPRRSADSRTATASEPAKQEQHVLDVLNRYRRAYDNMDVRAAQAVWPSAPTDKLVDKFKDLNGQRVQFASCRMSINGREAAARCQGDATFQTKIGSQQIRLTKREWTFNLSRDEAGWQIVNAELH